MSKLRSAPFVETRQYLRFKEFCDACRKDQYIGLCYGPPGVGKTLSGRHYADWDRLDAFLNRRERNGMTLQQALNCDVIFFTATAALANAPVKLDKAIEQLGDSLSLLHRLKVQEHDEAAPLATHGRLVALGKGSAPDLPGDEQTEADRQPVDTFKALVSQHVDRHREDRPATSLIIVDEVDLLKMAGLEQLRAIFDRGGIGLILIGMPGLEKRLARYPQLYSRVGFVHEFGPLSQPDVRQLLREGWLPPGVTLPEEGLIDEEAVAMLIRMTDGKFRLLHRMLTQISRVLEINQMDRVTVRVVEAARENLVIGTA